MMKRIVLCILIGIFLSLPISGFAKKELAIDLSFETIEERKNLRLSFDMDENEFFSSAKIRYKRYEDSMSKNHGQLKLGYDPIINELWSLWFFEQVGYDEKQGTDLENFAGGGLKRKLINREDLKFSISGGFLHHHLNYEENIDNLMRFSLRFKNAKQFSKNINFNLIIFYQPAIESFKDYIIDGKASIKYNFTEMLGMKLKIEDVYRSVTEMDEKNDLRTSLHITIDF